MASINVNSINERLQHGLRWSAFGQVVVGLIGTIGALVYTRMLQPEDLGAFGLAMLVFNGLFLLIEAPIRDAVVYFQDSGPEYDSAAFWILVGFSSMAVILVLLFAGALASFYRSPQSIGLVRVIALAFLARSGAVVPGAIILRMFRFALYETLDIVYATILFIGWVSLAMIGFGAWSLVLPVGIASLIWAVAVWLFAGFRPIWRPTRKAFHDILSYSASLFGSKLVAYIKGYIDNAAVGSLGERALGWYSLGEDQSGFAVTGVGGAISRIALPILAATRERLDEFQRIFLELLRLAASLSTPMQIGVLVLAELGVKVIFGDQWLGAVPVLQAYLIFRLVQTLLLLCNSATSAIGYPQVQFYTDLAQLPFFLLGTWFGLKVLGGYEGVAWSLALIRLTAGLVYLAVTLVIVRVTIKQTLRFLGPSTLAAIIMGLVVYRALHAGWFHVWIESFHSITVSNLLLLFCLMILGVVAYILLLAIIDWWGFVEVARFSWQTLFPFEFRQRIRKFFHR